MTDDRRHLDVEITDHGDTVATAEVSTSLEPQGTAHAGFHAEAGHLRAGTRTDLVDAVLDLPEVRDSAHLQAVVPIGDAESLARLQERTTDMTTHAAGSTALVDADIRSASDAVAEAKSA